MATKPNEISGKTIRSSQCWAKIHCPIGFPFNTRILGEGLFPTRVYAFRSKKAHHNGLTTYPGYLGQRTCLCHPRSFLCL